MKKIYFLMLSVFVLNVLSLFSQDQCASVGWANYNGTSAGSAPTGGGNASPIEVTTFGDLKKQVESSGAKVIYIKNSMGAGYKDKSGDCLMFTSDKTVIGYPGVVVKASFQLKGGTKNVIVRNITIQGPDATTPSQGWDNFLVDNSSKVWIDHCQFINGGDGNLDVTKGSDNVSVTWCVFTYTGNGDHNLSNLIGSADDETESVGKLNTTYYCCWWKGCTDRTPRVRFGQVDVVNCYMSKLSNVTSANSTAAGFKANIRVEGCVYEGVNNPCKIMSDTKTANQPSALTIVDCQFISCTGMTPASETSGGLAPFKRPYALTIHPTANVKAIVTNSTCGAGPTMDSPTKCGCGTVTEYTLNTVATNGTVTKNPNTATYASGTVVTLTATANTGYTFGSWSGDATGTTLTATVTMSANKNVTANFTAAAAYTLTIYNA